MTVEEGYLAAVAELQALSKNAPHITQADILEIASMPADELRRHAIRQRDWAGHWAHCLDGLGVWRMSGAAPIGGGEPTRWACSGMEDDPEHPGQLRYKPDRKVADQHYGDSEWIDRRQGGDSAVMELIARFLRTAGLEDATK